MWISPLPLPQTKKLELYMSVSAVMVNWSYITANHRRGGDPQMNNLIFSQKKKLQRSFDAVGRDLLTIKYSAWICYDLCLCVRKHHRVNGLTNEICVTIKSSWEIAISVPLFPHTPVPGLERRLDLYMDCRPQDDWSYLLVGMALCWLHDKN